MSKDKWQLLGAILIGIAMAFVVAKFVIWYNRELYGDPTCAIKQCVVVKP